MFSLDWVGVATGRNEREYQHRHDLTVPLRHDDKRNGRREALVQCGNPTNSKDFLQRNIGAARLG